MSEKDPAQHRPSSEAVTLLYIHMYMHIRIYVLCIYAALCALLLIESRRAPRRLARPRPRELRAQTCAPHAPGRAGSCAASTIVYMHICMWSKRALVWE